MKQEYNIVSFLGEGRENARSAEELAAIVGTDRRGVRRAINEARNAGALICSGVPGYWLSTDPAELRETHKRMNREALSILKALKHIRQKIKEAEAAKDE